MSAERYKMLLPKYKYSRAFCSEEDILIATSIKEFVDKEIMPRRRDCEGGWHRDEELALNTLYELYAGIEMLGVHIMNLPKKYGGLELSVVASLMITEEMGRGDFGLATLPGKTNWIVGTMLAAQRDDLLEEFSPRITSDEGWTACIAITEPGGGANLEDPAMEFNTIQTVAKLDGNEWVINGHKRWPGPSGPAGHFELKYMKGHLGYWVIATTDATKGPDGVGIFYIPPDVEGLSFSKPYEKMGLCWSDENCDIWLKNVRIPKKYRVDVEPGDGAKIVKSAIIGAARLNTSARLCGLSQAVLEIVLQFTGWRDIAGKPARERSLFASTIGEMFRMIELTRNYNLSIGWQKMHPEIYGEPWSPEMMGKYSLARSFAADTAEFCTNRGMELMGSYGYSYEYEIEKYMRDYKIGKMWLGGAHRDRLDIAQALYGPFTWGGYEEWLRQGGPVTS
jgi:alkylation response protein AidB-like acyl-CoA dehydrogenase